MLAGNAGNLNKAQFMPAKPLICGQDSVDSNICALSQGTIKVPGARD